MRTATSILLLATLLTALLPACKEVKRDVVATPANRDSVVSMKTRDVMTLISDSGMDALPHHGKAVACLRRGAPSELEISLRSVS